MLGVEAPAEDDPRLEALARLDLILGGLEGSRLVQAIRERRGLAYEVWSELEPGWGAGRAALYAATQAENVAACLALVAAVLAELRAGRVGRGEWQAAERAALARLALDWDQPAHWVWHQLPRVLRGEPPRGVEEALTRLRAVARDQMGALARAVWAPQRLRAVGVGPDRRSFLRAAEGLIGSTDEGRRPRG
jgi:predicted Zn-dependent peptidase